jgi:hypothetical protein
MKLGRVDIVLSITILGASFHLPLSGVDVVFGNTWRGCSLPEDFTGSIRRILFTQTSHHKDFGSLEDLLVDYLV